MKRVITGTVLAVSLISLSAAPVFATTIDGNDHGVIKVSSCSDIASIVNNNHGVIKIDGNNCNIEGATISGNNHGVFKINNVCGDLGKVTITNNDHGVVKVYSNGACPTPATSTNTSSVTVSDNNHGVIKVNGGAGNVVVSGNDHGVIKVDAGAGSVVVKDNNHGVIKVDTPKTPSTPSTPQTSSTSTENKVLAATTQKGAEVTELPSTGVAFPLATVSVLGALTYAGARLLARR